ncbi:Bacteriophage T5, Orf172 DNA-binding [Methylophilaceae bacterium]
MEREDLLKIIDSDDLGLLKIKTSSGGKPTADQRLADSFYEITAFYKKNGKEPEPNISDMHEFQLFSRLDGLRKNKEKAESLSGLDEFNLLETKEISSVDDIFNDDDLGLLKDDSESIFKIRHVPNKIDMPESIARRKPCKEFNLYEHLFVECKSELEAGIREARSFSGEQQIKQGHFFILHGVMVYVADVGEKETKNRKVNARLKLIFENGTESNMLLRSLATELYKDEAGRRILDHQDKALEDLELIKPEDNQTGFIYVLSSLSDKQEIKAQNNLYKIGFSKTPVSERIKNAAKEPTYLMSPVKVEAVYECFNLNPQKFELLLHTFFGESCLEVSVKDLNGKEHKPREWFIAPMRVIEVAVRLLINGEIINYSYNNLTNDIESRV